MSEIKRYPIKYIRDKVKSNYPKKTACEICGSEENLEFHHFNTLSVLYNEWAAREGHNPETAEDVMRIRDIFIEEYWDELVVQGACLCETHHQKLHSVYGKNPRLHTAPKQPLWIARQKEKQSRTPNESKIETSRGGPKPFFNF